MNKFDSAGHVGTCVTLYNDYDNLESNCSPVYRVTSSYYVYEEIEILLWM